MFPWAERGDSFDCLSHFRLVPKSSWMSESIVNQRQKWRVVERLLDKLKCTRPHCSHGRRHVAVRGHDDDRQAYALLAKRFQDGEPIHARHLHVEQHAAL